MTGKIFSIVIVIVAIAAGIFAVTLPSTRLDDLIVLAKFFDIMLPILGVGALIKYLFSCKK